MKYDLDYVSNTKLRDLRPDEAKIVIRQTHEWIWKWYVKVTIPAINKTIGSKPWDTHRESFSARTRESALKKVAKLLDEVRRRQACLDTAEELTPEDLIPTIEEKTKRWTVG